jgi:asparagine synthase (glutamine-hydrolysing)
VSSLLPGELQLHRADGTRLRAERYWSLPPSTHSGPVGEEELAQVLTESVRLHLVSDVPLGVFLSGGIDSSAVANLARRGGEAAVHTFTLAFEEPEWNEGPVARQIARAIGTEHREVLLTESDFVGQLEPALDSIDQPTFDGLNSHAMSRAVRQAGFTVALVGTGGDELFGGYPSFRELSRLHLATAWLPSPSRTALAALAARALATLRPAHPDVPRQTRWAKLPAMVRRADDLLALYQLAYALFLPGFQEALLGGEVPPGWSDGVPAPFRAELDRETAHRSDLATIGVLEQRLFLGERLLRDSDAASMAASLELRLPLVDVEVLRTVLGLGDRERFRPLMRKEALRRVGLEGLPPELFTRPKQGFVLPYERWIRRGLGTSIDATLRDAEAVRAAGLAPAAVERLWRGYQDGAPGLYWSRIWALYVLVRWCQQHGVRS